MWKVKNAEMRKCGNAESRKVENEKMRSISDWVASSCVSLSPRNDELKTTSLRGSLVPDKTTKQTRQLKNYVVNV